MIDIVERLRRRAAEIESVAQKHGALDVSGAVATALNNATQLREAADEIERLRAALQTMVYETTHLSPQEDDGSHKCKISKAALDAARAALTTTEGR